MSNRAHKRAAAAEGKRRRKRGWNAFQEGPDPQGADGATRSWYNNFYVVLYVPPIDTDIGLVERIMIRPTHDQTDVSWTHKQRIKNELFGPERAAVEVFPAESQKIDNYNIYHLWIPPKDYALPFGLD